MKSKAFFAFAIAFTLLFSTVASASVVSADDNVVLDNGNAKFVFIGVEYTSMSDDELQSIADAVYLRDLRTRAAANLTTKSCANNSTVSWGPYTSTDKCSISWKVTSDKARQWKEPALAFFQM